MHECVDNIIKWVFVNRKRYVQFLKRKLIALKNKIKRILTKSNKLDSNDVNEKYNILTGDSVQNINFNHTSSNLCAYYRMKIPFQFP